jgi:lathosterol oxidase
MDLVLRVCDELFLDKIWAAILPIPAFVHPNNSQLQLNSSTLVQSLDAKCISSIPNPTLSPSCPSELHGLPARLLSAWPRDYVPRQLLSLSVITLIGIVLLYFIIATLSYIFIFNHEMMRHPRFLKNQVKLEIQTSLRAFPGMTVLTLPWFQAEVMGYSKLYDDVDQYGWWYLVASVPL